MGQCCSSDVKDLNEMTTAVIDVNLPSMTFAVDFDVDEVIRFREFSLKITRRYGEFFKDDIDVSECTEISDGKKLLHDNSLYIGNWKDGKMSGYGQILYSNDDFYSGSFLDGMKNGRGRLISKSPENHSAHIEYIGEFKDDLKHGKGKIIYEASHYYKGDWEEDHPHGIGEEYWRDKESGKSFKYSGSFFKGAKEGHGRIDNIDDGAYYEGNLKENAKFGHGIFDWGDGRIYEGQWRDNEMDGDGEFIYPNGSIYKGEFVKGKKEGMGEYKWADKINSYIGNWKNGARNGYGVLYKHKVGELFGEWKEDKFIKAK